MGQSAFLCPRSLYFKQRNNVDLDGFSLNVLWLYCLFIFFLKSFIAPIISEYYTNINIP